MSTVLWIIFVMTMFTFFLIRDFRKKKSHRSKRVTKYDRKMETEIEMERAKLEETHQVLVHKNGKGSSSSSRL